MADVEVQQHPVEHRGGFGHPKGPMTRRPRGIREIPRAAADEKTKGMRRQKNRTVSESSGTSTGRRNSRTKHHNRGRSASETSGLSEGTEETTPMRALRVFVEENHERKGLNLLNSFVKNRLELAKFENTTHFLERCEVLQIIPNKYRLNNKCIKNTKPVVRALDRFSFQILLTDLKYNRKRAFQVSRLLREKETLMKEVFPEDLVKRIHETAEPLFERRHKRLHDQQEKIYESLLTEYEISDDEKADAMERLNRRAERKKARDEKRATDRKQREQNNRANEERHTDDNSKKNE